MTETDLKISQLPEETTPQNADVFAISVDLGSTPTTKKITLANLITAINKPAGSSGQIQFNDAGAFGGSDNLFWDSVNGRLGIGTTGPGYNLDVAGTSIVANFGTDPAVIAVGNVGIVNAFLGGYYTVGGNKSTIYFGQNSYYSGSAWVNPDAGANTSLFLQQGGLFQFYTGGAGSGVGTGRLRLHNSGGLSLGSSDNYLTTDPGAGSMIIAGNVGIGETSPTISDGIGLHLAGKILRIATSKTPATAGAAGNAGEICWDADSLYCCVATNTWKKVAIATW